MTQDIEEYERDLCDKMARMDKIFELREAGMTLAAIGKIFGLSKNRVSGLLFKRERIYGWWENYFNLVNGLTKEERMKIDIRSIALSTRVRYAFKDFRRKYTVEDVMKMSDEELLKIPGMGRLTLSETRKSIAILMATAAPLKEEA
jgi:hypothetical protein